MTSSIDFHDREAFDQEAFISNLTHLYVPRPDILERLDLHAQGFSPPLVIFGEPGIGKSALLANWLIRFRLSNPDNHVIFHLSTGSPSNVQHCFVLDKLLKDLNCEFNLRQIISDRPENLYFEFKNFLSFASTRSKVILIIDGLDEFQFFNDNSDLIWLPQLVPPNVRLVLSTANTQDVKVFEKYGWETLAIEPLNIEERKIFIREFLKKEGQILSSAQIDRIANSVTTSNPAFLKTLLIELRYLCQTPSFDAAADLLLASSTLTELYSKIFQNLHQEFDNELKGLLADCLSTLWASRCGLSEAELFEGIKSKFPDLPNDTWVRFFERFNRLLLPLGKRLIFSHVSLRDQIKQQFISRKEDQVSAHQGLVDFFTSGEFTDNRLIEELPWQLAITESWEKLKDFLANPKFFKHFFETNPLPLFFFWNQIILNSSFRPINVHASNIQNPNQDPGCIPVLARLLNLSDANSEAVSLSQFLLELNRKKEKPDDLRNLVYELGVRCSLQGDLDEALNYFSQLEGLSLHFDDKCWASDSILFQGLIFHAKNNLDQSLLFLQRYEHTCRDLDDMPRLCFCLGRLAVIYYLQNDFKRAFSTFQEQERVSKKLGNIFFITESLKGQAVIFRAQHEFFRGLECLRKLESVCREIYYLEGLQVSLNDQGSLLTSHGNLFAAYPLFKEAESHCRNLLHNIHIPEFSSSIRPFVLPGKPLLTSVVRIFSCNEHVIQWWSIKNGLQTALGGQGIILRDRGQTTEAIKLLKEAESICREMKHYEGLFQILRTRAMALFSQNENNEALSLFVEVESISNTLDIKSDLHRLKEAQNLISNTRADVDNSLLLLKEHERSCRKVSYRDGLQRILAGQNIISQARGDVNKAIMRLRDIEVIFQDVEFKYWSQRALEFYLSQGKTHDPNAKVLILFRELDKFCRDLSAKAALQGSLGQQVITMKIRGDTAGANSFSQDQERLCREIGSHAAFLRNSADQILMVVQKQVRLRSVLTSVEQAFKKAKESGMANLVEEGKKFLDAVQVQILKDGYISEDTDEWKQLLLQLNTFAGILKNEGSLIPALDQLKIQEQIFRSLGYSQELATCLLNQANILRDQGEFSEADARFGESETNWRLLENMENLAETLSNHALLLALNMNKFEEAFPLVDEANRISKECKLDQPSQEVISNLLDLVRMNLDVSQLSASPKGSS